MPPSEYYGNEEASGLRVVSLLLKQKLDTLPKLAVFTLSLLVLVKTVSVS